MNAKTYYTAIGNMKKIHAGPDKAYPVIVINRKEYPVDLQEMTVWTALCWRILDQDQICDKFEALSQDNCYTQRTLDSCIQRLKARGLIAAGTGETDFDAIYDLLGGLYVVPLSTSPVLRLGAFVKMMLQGVPFSKAKILLRAEGDVNGEPEHRVMKLCRQALLSTAELIKCVESGTEDVSTDDKLLRVLYDDEDTTCDNLPELMQQSASKIPVTMAVANLYLRKRIIFERL